MRLTIASLLLVLPGTVSAAPTCNLIQQTLKRPAMLSYQMVMKEQKFPAVMVGGKEAKPATVIPSKTFVTTSSVKPIPNGIQMTTTDEGKTNVVNMTCVNGKVRMEVDGKVIPSDVGNPSKDVQVTAQGLNDATSFDFTKHKVGETWSGTLSKVKMQGVSSVTTYTNKILGVEKVTTPAGTFDAYKVQQQFKVDMTMPDMPKGMTMPNMKPVVTTMWYAKDIPGLMVKSVSDSMTMTLLKYSK